ncbi:MAG: hypothetical protein Q8L81_00030 [Bacteroidota bacterium]|nr:hypothetical protein [Bacteroidota bacterium]
MNKKINIKALLFIVTLCFSFSFMKQDSPKKIAIKTKLDYFATDNLGNLYTVKENELIKYLLSGKLFARYSNLKLGNISTVDATNPLKLLLYYRDFQQIIFLDNQLTNNSEPISLEKLGYEQTDLVCASANNSFWIYNKQNNELVRFNEASKQIAATGNLKQVLQAELKPNFMIEHNGFLFLNSPETGIFVFDIFGTFNKIISLKNLKRFDVSDEIIYFQKDSLFCSYNYRLFEEVCKNNCKADQINYAKNRLYKSYGDSLVIEPLTPN